MAQSSARGATRATGRSSRSEARIASNAPRGGGIGRVAPASRGGSLSRASTSPNAARRFGVQSLMRPRCGTASIVAGPDACGSLAFLSEARCCRMTSVDPATAAASRST
eukprot:scaffold6413_cov121-Isochrysis_galbana.AAC.9